MEKLSSKFANLAGLKSGIARQMAKPGERPAKVSKPIKTIDELAKALDIDPKPLKERVKRWRKKNPDRARKQTRAAVKKYRARKKAKGQ